MRGRGGHKVDDPFLQLIDGGLSRVGGEAGGIADIIERDVIKQRRSARVVGVIRPACITAVGDRRVIFINAVCEPDRCGAIALDPIAAANGVLHGDKVPVANDDVNCEKVFAV